MKEQKTFHLCVSCSRLTIPAGRRINSGLLVYNFELYMFIKFKNVKMLFQAIDRKYITLFMLVRHGHKGAEWRQKKNNPSMR